MAMCPSVLIDSRNHSGMTPLMKAALQGRIRCTRLLLLAGASPILRDFRRSMCALEWARYTGRTKCIEIIEKVTITSSKNFLKKIFKLFANFSSLKRCN